MRLQKWSYVVLFPFLVYVHLDFLHFWKYLHHDGLPLPLEHKGELLYSINNLCALRIEDSFAEWLFQGFFFVIAFCTL